MSINGKVEEGTMEIDTANNMERFSTGSGADEAVEVHDFEIVSRMQIKSHRTQNTRIWSLLEEADWTC